MTPLYILLVEDDLDDVELMQEALKDSRVDYKMDTVQRGDEVLPWLEAAKRFPDVILLDLNLPNLHGKEVLQLLKGSTRFRKIPVVVLTTTSAKEEADFCMQAGADKFISKPYTLDEFAATTAAILQMASTGH